MCSFCKPSVGLPRQLQASAPRQRLQHRKHLLIAHIRKASRGPCRPLVLVHQNRPHTLRKVWPGHGAHGYRVLQL